MAGLAALWVGSACAGWLPRQWAVVSQAWWWGVASIIVLAVGWTNRPWWRCGEPGWWLWGVTWPVLGWLPRMPGSALWLIQTALVMASGVCLLERWGWRPLRQAVVWWAWAQMALGLPALAGVTLYPNGWTGTIGSRGALAIWLGMASCWSAGWRSRVLAIGSVLTGSLSGLPAIVRHLPMRWRHPLTWVSLVAAALLTSPVWREKLALRMSMWVDALNHTKTHWCCGWGLQILPVGFQEVSWWGAGERIHYAPATDLHSIWMDVALRGGLFGVVSLLTLMGWAGWRARQTNTWWSWGLAVWAMTWQSVGASPALLCLSLVWLLSLCRVEPCR